MAAITDALLNAASLFRAGRVLEAAQICQGVLADDPNCADAWHFLGAIAYQSGNYPLAVEQISRALELQPGLAAAHNNLGRAWQELARLDDAVQSYLRAVALDRSNSDALYNLGNVLLQAGQLESAIEHYRLAIESNPRFAEAHNNLGTIFLTQKRFDDAESCFRRAIELKPVYPDAYYNLGTCFKDLGNLPEAAHYLQQAVAQRPDYPQACNNLGGTLFKLGRYDEASGFLRRALDLMPDLAEARWNLSTIKLLHGDFEHGWPEYEWRWKTGVLPLRRFAQPAWTGQPLNGRSILLYAEQGLGDTIQFVRYAALVKDRGAHVIVECQQPLVSILQSCSGIDTIVACGSELPSFDYHAPLLSLPGIFQTRLDTIPAREAYLSADPALVAQWRERLSGIRGCRVAIHWRGRLGDAHAKKRDIPLSCFNELGRIPGVRLISVQKGATREELAGALPGVSVVEFGDDLDHANGPFMDTAAILKNVDLLITSDTSMPHLAGALGARVWLALPFVPEWRWLLDRSDSPWYPTMRLFRQKSPGNWGFVFSEVREALGALLQKLPNGR
jgi:tetratricopeptide (TPR) repeat protein